MRKYNFLKILIILLLGLSSYSQEKSEKEKSEKEESGKTYSDLSLIHI